MLKPQTKETIKLIWEIVFNIVKVIYIIALTVSMVLGVELGTNDVIVLLMIIMVSKYE